MIANLLSREQDKLTALAVMERLMSQRAEDSDALVAYALLAIRAEDMDRSDTAMRKIVEAGNVDTNIAITGVNVRAPASILSGRCGEEEGRPGAGRQGAGSNAHSVACGDSPRPAARRRRQANSSRSRRTGR